METLSKTAVIDSVMTMESTYVHSASVTDRIVQQTKDKQYQYSAKKA